MSPQLSDLSAGYVGQRLFLVIQQRLASGGTCMLSIEIVCTQKNPLSHLTRLVVSLLRTKRNPAYPCTRTTYHRASALHVHRRAHCVYASAQPRHLHLAPIHLCSLACTSFLTCMHSVSGENSSRSHRRRFLPSQLVALSSIFIVFYAMTLSSFSLPALKLKSTSNSYKLKTSQYTAVKHRDGGHRACAAYVDPASARS
jgi:hypothetical protein